MYYLVIRQFTRTLKNLDTILGKAEQHADARKFDVNNFCTERLYPDMLPFTVQIRIACDAAKIAAASLAGKEAPQHEDTEVTFADLRGRIGKCIAYLESFSAKDFERTTAETLIKVPVRNQPVKALRANDYLLARQIPNFYFHVTTAYNILRQGGVEIGKKDYLGALEFLEFIDA
jgi:hypothetical protein